jgi:exodeoxyribonuclease-3
LRFATYNVNGIGARLPRLLAWLDRTRPDVVGLQEIKTETDRFPFAAIEGQAKPGCRAALTCGDRSDAGGG